LLTDHLGHLEDEAAAVGDALRSSPSPPAAWSRTTARSAPTEGRRGARVHARRGLILVGLLQARFFMPFHANVQRHRSAWTAAIDHLWTTLADPGQFVSLAKS